MTEARMWTTEWFPRSEFRFDSEAEYLSRMATIPHKDSFLEGDKIFIHIRITDCRKKEDGYKFFFEWK